jgi:hypothetical protein
MLVIGLTGMASRNNRLTAAPIFHNGAAAVPCLSLFFGGLTKCIPKNGDHARNVILLEVESMRMFVSHRIIVIVEARPSAAAIPA